jgi:phosphatidylglycerophosphate synthase
MDDTNRRPVAARGWDLNQRLARSLARTNITPNQISLASIVFSGLAALCMIELPGAGARSGLLSYLAAGCILARGECNVLDGLVAVEGGKGTKAGELFNDIPDRISDTLYLVAAGYGTTVVSWAPQIGWAAALLAVMTAYVRALGRGLGTGSDFRGPMAKTQRMATIGIALLLTPFERFLWPQGYCLLMALLIVCAGSIVTTARRAIRAYRLLEGK